MGYLRGLGFGVFKTHTVAIEPILSITLVFGSDVRSQLLFYQHASLLAAILTAVMIRGLFCENSSKPPIKCTLLLVDLGFMFCHSNRKVAKMQINSNKNIILRQMELICSNIYHFILILATFACLNTMENSITMILNNFHSLSCFLRKLY